MRIAFVVGVAVLLVVAAEGTAQTGRPVKNEPVKGTTKPPPSTTTSPSTPLPKGPKRLASKTLSEWIHDLYHGDASYRSVAILAIMQPVFLEEAHRAVPDIVKLLSDSDASPRAKACLALRTITVNKEDVPRVVRALANRLWFKNEKEVVVRYEAAMTLRRFAPDAAEAIPALINSTLDRVSWETRHICAATLWRAALATKEGTDPRAVQALLDMLHPNRASRTTYQERLEAIIGLGSLKKSKNPYLQDAVVKELYKASTTRLESNKPLAIWAYAGLVAQNPDSAEKYLSAMAKYLTPDRKLETRVQAVQAIAALGKKAKSRLPTILAMLKDKEAVAVDGACLALVRMGDTSDKVIDALIDVTRHTDANRVGSAIVALVNLKVNTPEVTAALEKVIKTEQAKEAKEVRTGLIKLAQQALTELKKPREAPKAAKADRKVVLPRN